MKFMTTGSIRFLLRSDLQKLSLPRIHSKGFKLWLKLLSPRFLPVLFIRLSCSLYKRKLTRPFAVIPSLFNGILFGLEVTPRCKIGKGLYLPHTFGTVIGASQIGDDVTIFQGVTLGAKFADIIYTEESRPVIGDRVIIGAGAKVLGSLIIGDDCVIAANSLVIQSVPNNSFMIGVPAMLKNGKKDE